MPWCVRGAVIAGVVQEIPPRRAPAVMLGLSAVIVTLFVSPFALLVQAGKLYLALVVVHLADWGSALALGVAVLALLIALQPVVDRVMAFLARRRYLSIFGCGLLGLVIPMCECGIIPLTRRLLRQGLPISCCVTVFPSGPRIQRAALLPTYLP